MIDIEIEYGYHCHNGDYFDFLLKNGVRLHSEEWNGEVYTVKNADGETTYRPVYRETSPDEWEIVGFSEY